MLYSTDSFHWPLSVQCGKQCYPICFQELDKVQTEFLLIKNHTYSCRISIKVQVSPGYIQLQTKNNHQSQFACVGSYIHYINTKKTFSSLYSPIGLEALKFLQLLANENNEFSNESHKCISNLTSYRATQCDQALRLLHFDMHYSQHYLTKRLLLI